MEKKKALITGITGQDGSYLAEFLLKKGYEVYGIVRRSSTFNWERIEHLKKKDEFFDKPGGLVMYYGDLTDSSSIEKVIDLIKPDEVYNLGAQSHVGISFEVPENTTDIVALGTLRILEAIRKFCPKARYYQASSSEMFGKVEESPQSEKTKFHPRSPYGCAKVYAYDITVNYREAYGLHASNGILFNHESERRGENFVTRKITRNLTKIKLGLIDHFALGNLDAKRDWGHAEDFVEAMWLMLQQDEPGDYVVGTGEIHSVREFLEEAAKDLGLKIKSNGKKGIEEEYIDENGKTVLKIDKRYFRPSEVEILWADPSKAKKILQWEPKIKFKDLVIKMVDYDLKLAQKEAYLCGRESDVGEKIASAIKPLLEFADKYGIKIPSEKNEKA
ncbi:MAG: GDP-mannose 4,6-dehydratase [Candidatus Pacearchaeota archaeon]|nr:GDP-mannose 4,6-dehydratase [Candidatus Pacearchaeota archaeon]